MSEVSFMRLMDAQAKPRVIIDHNPSYASGGPKDPRYLRSKLWDRPKITKKAAIQKGKRERDWLLVEPTEASIHTPMPNYTWKRILHEVAEKHNISVQDMVSSKRTAHFVLARNEACYRMRSETNLSLPAIGWRMGGRDHTTVMHAIERYVATNGSVVIGPTKTFIRNLGFEERKGKKIAVDNEIAWMLKNGMSSNKISQDMGVNRKRVLRVKKEIGL